MTPAITFIEGGVLLAAWIVLALVLAFAGGRVIAYGERPYTHREDQR